MSNLGRRDIIPLESKKFRHNGIVKERRVCPTSSFIAHSQCSRSLFFQNPSLTPPPPELESSLNKLSLAPQNAKKPSSKKQHAAPVADSWEDDDLSSGSETDRPLTATESASYPDPPPPTPISPTGPYSRNEADRFASPYAEWSPGSSNSNGGIGAGPRNDRERGVEKRPEKTDAVAKRMIAGALGVRAPKKTEEQRAYERAVREKEIKRIQAEKEEGKRREEERERAKAAAWSD